MDMSEIGGGIVRRTFSMAGKQLFAGHKLTREQVLAIPLANRNVLIDKKWIELWQRPPGMTRFMSPNGDGSFDVIEGRRINDDPLTEAQARELAGVTDEPTAAKPKRSNRKKKQTKH